IDAWSRLCFGGALAHRGGSDVGLSAAQRARAPARQAIGRRNQISSPRRDRCAQPRLQPLFGGNLAGLGILGEQGGLRSHAQQARARARPQEIVSGLVTREKADFAAVPSALRCCNGGPLTLHGARERTAIPPSILNCAPKGASHEFSARESRELSVRSL